MANSEELDLLKISDTLDDINGEVVGDSPDYGMHYTYLYIGMSGQKMVDKMNENFHATDAEFLAIAKALGARIISSQIKEIKEDNGVVYYTTDGENWIPLQASWGKIVGNLSNQTDLANALSDKIGTEQFNALAGTVNTNTSNISILNVSLEEVSNLASTLNNQINSAGGILIRLDSAESSLSKKITSEQVLEIRTSNGTALEFTTDGETWFPVSSAGIVEWGQIEGNIEEQADLVLKFNNITNSMKDLEDTINLHTSDTNNPHGVTKSQVGLENVDNTSDENKPVSTPQKEYIDSVVGLVSTTKEDYEALETKNPNTLYLINNI